MAKLNYNLSKLSDTTYKEIVKELLNRVESLKLELSGKSKTEIDLRQYDKKNKTETVVEIKRNPNITKNDLVSILERIDEYLEDNYNSNYYLVLSNSIDNNSLENIYEYAGISLNYNLKIYDINWIQHKLFENPDIVKKFSLKLVNNKDFKTFNAFVNSKRKYFAVSYMWGAENKSLDFINKSYWSDISNEKNDSITKSILPGDILILHGQNKNHNRLFAVGIVIENNFESEHKLTVNWNRFAKPDSISVNEINPFMSNIEPIIYSDAKKILLSIQNWFPSIIDLLLNADVKTGSKEKDLNYWWINVDKKHWSFEDYKEGDTISFSDVIIGYKNKEEITLFNNIIKEGDEIIAYQIDKDKGKTVAFLKVVGKDSTSPKIKISRILGKDRQFSIDQLKILPDFDMSEVVSDKNKKTYYQLTKREFEEVVIYNGVIKTPLESENDKEDEPSSEQTKDKIPFHLDQVVDEDKLGREPVAKAFTDLIKKDIFTDKLDHSFIVHLQGEWGSGKSSFLNFIKENLNSGDDEWIVVNYNAWQNQHIKPPWWTLINQVYKGSLSELGLRSRSLLWLKESIRRIFRYTPWQKVIVSIVTVFLFILLIKYSDGIVSKFSTWFGLQTGSKNNVTIVSLIVSIASIAGIFFTFTRYLTKPFFTRSSESAESFLKKASDPTNRIKKHFTKLVYDINRDENKNLFSKLLKKLRIKTKKRQLAIFIDDIDRCNKKYIVQLLEGIQTLFKEQRVLYIVVGDKQWITKSFGNTYKEFAEQDREEDYHKLGEKFLEKAFQLSIRLPNISDEAKERYWNYILGIEEEVQKTTEDNHENIEKAAIELAKAKNENSGESITDPNYMQGIEDEFNLSSDAVSNMVIEEVNKDQEDIKHLLKGFYAEIDSNPRSIIRLANNYTMIRSTLIAERKNFTSEKVFRWLVIEDLFSEIKSKINGVFTLKEIETFINEKFKNDERVKSNCLTLLLDKENTKGGALEIQEIKDIIGL